MTDAIDVLVPTCDRPAALAVTLTSLLGQTLRPARVVVSDQGELLPAAEAGEVVAVVRALRHHGVDVTLTRHLPKRGLAEQRQFLLDQAEAAYALYLDDDVVCAPTLLARLHTGMTRARCGFVGSAVIGLSYLDDVRPHEQRFERWDGPVRPERVAPGTPEWERHRLHNAANLAHVARDLGLTDGDVVLYKVAWIGGCVLYDVAKLRAVGGFGFWTSLPPGHCGEDVVAQQRVIAEYGGAGLLPSGAYHQELPTTVVDRSVDAPHLLADGWAGSRGGYRERSWVGRARSEGGGNGHGHDAS